MTAQELLEYSHEPYRQELVGGILHEVEPLGAEHGAVASEIGDLLKRHVKEAGLGIVFTSEIGYQLASDPDTVRGPDLSFVTRARLDATGMPAGYWPGPPDLAVEVVSPNDRLVQVESKAQQWIAAGARAVLVVDPPRRLVSVYRSQGDVRVVHADQAVDLSDVVPGWSPLVGDFFAF